MAWDDLPNTTPDDLPNTTPGPKADLPYERRYYAPSHGSIFQRLNELEDRADLFEQYMDRNDHRVTAGHTALRAVWDVTKPRSEVEEDYDGLETTMGWPWDQIERWWKSRR
jgi:hypothetical protein